MKARQYLNLITILLLTTAMAFAIKGTAARSTGSGDAADLSFHTPPMSDYKPVDRAFHTPPMSDYRPVDHSFHTPPMSDYRPVDRSFHTPPMSDYPHLPPR